MKTQTAYCSACDRDVNIVITDEPSQDGQANLHESEIVCLEIGSQCTGGLCPVGATSSAVMAARLIRNGLYTYMQPMVTQHCDGCGAMSEFVALDTKFATCTVCGTTIEWKR
ncbi:MAG TPA: hypothetical protein VFT29_12180 [Gemmatimonadaceae bacterium]|nr:hypothetical protein [Gemmatimonadaceae bacterium]